MDETGTFAEVTHEGVTITSNSQTDAELRASLGLEPEAAAAATDAVAETPATEAVAEPEPTPTDRNADGTFKAKPRSDPKARVEAATAKEAEAKRLRDETLAENARLKAEIDALKRPKEPVAQTPTAAIAEPEGFPDYATWAQKAGNADKPYEAYIDDRNDWRWALNDKKSQSQRAEQSRYDNFLARVKATPDWDTKFKPETALARDLVPYIQDHDQGPQILLYLSEHPDLAQRIATLHPIKQIEKFGEIVGLLSARPAAAEVRGPAVETPPASRAKAPIKPLGSSPQVSDDPPGEDASDAEHEAYWGPRRKQFRG